MKITYESGALIGAEVTPGPARPGEARYTINGPSVELAFGDTITTREHGSGIFLESLSSLGSDIDEHREFAQNNYPWFQMESSDPNKNTPAMPVYHTRRVYAPTYPGSNRLHTSRQVLTHAMGDLTWINISPNARIVDKDIREEERLFAAVIVAVREQMREGGLTADECYAAVAGHLPEGMGSLQQRADVLKQVLSPQPAGSFQASLLGQVQMLRAKCPWPSHVQRKEEPHTLEPEQPSTPSHTPSMRPSR